MSFNRRHLLQLGALASTVASAPLARPALAHGPTLAVPSSWPLKILVLGGTRYLGPAVVRAALARGHDVTLFNRGKTQPGLFPGLKRLIGDRFPEIGAGLAPLETGDWDAVIDLCAYYPRLVEASTRLLAPRVGRYIMVSSISVYSDLRTVGQDETAPVTTLNRPFEELPDLSENDWPTYGGRKAAAEAIVQAAFGERATVLRPCGICGGDNNDGGGAYWTARLHRGGKVLVPGDGTDPVQLIDMADVADFAILAAERSLGGAYNVLGPAKPLTFRECLETSARIANSRAEIVWKGDFPHEMYGLPMVAPFSLVPGFSTMRNDKARAAGLRFRPLEETLRTNWIDHRARRGDDHDFAAAGMGLTSEKEAELMAA